MMILLDIFVVLFGLAFGSFLNVCISRIPKEESVVRPPSHCMSCGKTIFWYDNIPVVSYLLLKGKCRQCGKAIPLRYPAVEVFSGLIWFFLWKLFGLSPHFAGGVVLYSILLAVSMTDWETGYIPDLLTLPGMVFGLILSVIAPAMREQSVWYHGLLDSFLGLLAGGGILLATGLLGSLIFRKDAMGGGDIKLLAMIGAFVGWKQVIFVYLFSPILAVPFALYAKWTSRAETIPYGPYLALTGAVFFIYGNQIMQMLFPI